MNLANCVDTVKAEARVAAGIKARADAVQLRWNTAKALISGNPYVEHHEVHGTATGGDMVLHWGFTSGLHDAGGTILVTLVSLTGSTSYPVRGTPAQIKAAVRLFIEGDEGNEHLYPLAEPIQPSDKSFRFIP